MGTEDMEQLLENARFRHLSEATLVSYRDNQLDETGLTLADVHLNLCLICERRLTFLKEEAAALESYTTTDEDRALIAESIKKQHPEARVREPIQTEIKRLAAYIEDLLNAWIVPFSQPARRGARDGDEVWSYESEDGLLKAWAILERDASLTVHFSATEMAWEGARLRFRLGPFSKDVTLHRVADAEVAAEIKIPRHQRAKRMNDIEIELLAAH